MKDDSGDIASTVDYPGSSSSLSFNYDNNGNVTGEPHKQITLDYNLINLPREINLNGQNKYIYYYYTFDGAKLRKTVENNGVITKTDYCGPFVYETVSGTRSLKYLITPEGRAVKSGSNWDYEYNLKDHLGNVKVVIHKGTNGSAEVIQERHYYPFGMEMGSLSTGSSSNKYLYNSKEHENDFDLDWYDYGARFYDPELGRFHTVDPLTEKYSSQSPFVYADNNPVRFIDYMGMGTDGYTIDEEGYIKRVDDTGGDNYDVLYTKGDYEKSKASGVTNQDGNPEPENQVKVSDTSILPNLEKVSSDFQVSDLAGFTSDGSFAKSSNAKDVKSIFEFAAKNSNVEWGRSKFTDGNWMIGTNHEGSIVGNLYNVGGYSATDLVRDYHSHPGTNPYDDKASNVHDTWGDIPRARNITRRSLKATNNDYSKVPKFFIFRPHVNTPYYFEYDAWDD